MSTVALDPRGIRRILLAGAVVFGASALALLVSPGAFLALLGLPDSEELQWAMRMIAITLVALTGNMAVVSRSASARGVVAAAVVMMVSAGGLGVVTLLIPTDPTWFVVGYGLVGFGFSSAYLVGLALHAKRPREDVGDDA